MPDSGTQAPELDRWLDAFLTAKRAEGLATRSLALYRHNLGALGAWCAGRGAERPEQITPDLLRQWLLSLEARHNPGGVHQYYRAAKAFLRWYELEAAAPGWPNPIRRVRAPRLPETALDPVPLADVTAMLQACRADRLGPRNRAILLTLLDTGVRASELCAFTLADYDPIAGTFVVRAGKGGKRRTVFAGQRTRRALRAWLKERGKLAADAPLFANQSGRRLTYCALRGLVDRAADRAGVPRPGLHAFRRQFTLSMLRAGADLLTLQRLLGHASMTLLARYAKQTNADLQSAHSRASPADSL